MDTNQKDGGRQQFVTASNVDLSNCDREQIHIPGAIQPHSALLVVDEQTFAVVQASANCDALLGMAHAEVIGKPLAEVIGGYTVKQVSDRLDQHDLDNGPCHLRRSPFMGRDCDVFAHLSSGVVIVEIEVTPSDEWPAAARLNSDLRIAIARLQTADSLQTFFDHAVLHLRRFTGFERVVAYKFLEDDSGHVIAEAKADGLEPYLGLHYPASDIPAPARRMFALSWLRHLPDVNYQPVKLMPELHPTTGAQVDLSYSLLRSVSVMYSEYLKNMGVQSTMVMPLLRDGRLWGLISAMHHSAPRHVPHEARMAAEFLAHMLSLMMASKEDAETFAYRLKMQATLGRMTHALATHSDLHAALTGGGDQDGVANYIESGGAALVTDGEITRLGAAPNDDDLRQLAYWLAQRNNLVTATDRLPEQYAPAGKLAAIASGLLAIRLSKRRPEFVMWFRPEQAQTVRWAGDPGKPVEVDETARAVRLRPRSSFALWQQTVASRSRPWAEFEIKAAADLRWGIVEVILARVHETERLNRELMDVNLELDSFAYVASHDLKEPLRGITHMATFLERGQSAKLDEQGRAHIASIVKLTKRMDDLIESLLHYSRVGRAEPIISDCHLDDVLDDALLFLKARIAETGTEIRRPCPLPTVPGDPVRLRDVLANLISNAIKYNDTTERWVEIGWIAEDPPKFYVRDNGLGIAEKDHEQVFQIFRRLHGRDEYGGGTGAGLTIARKTIERHGGKLWVESTLGGGSTFWFTLPGKKAN